MQHEFDSLQSNDTESLVDLPPSRQVVNIIDLQSQDKLPWARLPL
jgi:hypothetical protein